MDYSQNHSLEYLMGDEHESLVFSPDQDMMMGVDRSDLNSEWNENVADFLEAGKTTISAMRLEVGGDHVTFEIDGALIDHAAVALGRSCCAISLFPP